MPNVVPGSLKLRHCAANAQTRYSPELHPELAAGGPSLGAATGSDFKQLRADVVFSAAKEVLMDAVDDVAEKSIDYGCAKHSP